MSNASFHVDPDIEGSVVELLEESGYEVTIGNSPIVDYYVDRSDDDEDDER